MLSLFEDDITKKEKRWQQQLTMAMRPDLHHLLLSQVDATKLKDLEFQFLHCSTVSKLRLDRLLNQKNRGFHPFQPIRKS